MKKFCWLIAAIYAITTIGAASAQSLETNDTENISTNGAQEESSQANETLNETPKSEAKILISEISFQDPETDWVELFALAGGTLSKWTLEDDKTIYVFEEMSVERGDMVVVKIEKGLTGTSEQMIVRDAEGNIADAVCWANDAIPASEKKDMEELFREGGWIADDPATCIQSGEVGKGWSIGRRAAWDTDAAEDWTIFPHATPNALNITANATPRARIGIQSGTTTRQAPLAINIASESADPDGDPLAYRWEFRRSATDAGQDPAPLFTSDKENPPSYTFENPGNYEIALTVTDSSNAESTHTIQVTAFPPPEPKPECPTQNACPTHSACPAAPKCPDIKIPDFSKEIAKLPVCKIRESEPEKAKKTKQEEKFACEPKPIIPVFLSEILPNPEGKDEGAEWVKLVNTSSQDILIRNWKLAYGATEIPIDGKIAAHKTMEIQIVKNALRNKSDHVKLITSENLIQDETIYDNAKNGAIYAKLPNGTWEWKTPEETSEEKTRTPEKTENETAGTKTDTKTKSEKTATGATVTKTSAATETNENGDISNDIAISEIMPNPGGNDDGNEWIELWNRGNENINLGNWKIKTSKKSSVLPDSTIIPAHEYRAFDLNDTGLTLINTGDTIKLLDFQDTQIDTLTYEKAPDNQSFAKIEIETVNGETPNANTARAASEKSQTLWQWTTDITKNEQNPRFKRIIGTITETKPETFTIATNNRNFHIIYNEQDLDPRIANMVIAPSAELEIVTEQIADNVHALKTLRVIREAQPKNETQRPWIAILAIILICGAGGFYLTARGIPEAFRTRLRCAISGSASTKTGQTKTTWERWKARKDCR